MKAQEKLKQNGGNIEIFQKLRNTLKKPKRGKGNHRTQSKLGSQQPQIQENQQLNLPELGRNKTFPFQQQMKEQKSQQNQRQSQLCQKMPKRRGRKPKKQPKQQFQKEQQEQQKKQQDGQNNPNQNNEVQQSSSSSLIAQQKKLGYRTRLRRISRREEKQKIKIQAKKEQQEEQEQKQQEDQKSQNQLKYQRQYPLRVKTKPIYRNMPKKRGRPKKVQLIQNQFSSSEQIAQNSENENEEISQKFKQIKQRLKQIKQRQRPTGQNRKSKLQRTLKTVQTGKNVFKQVNVQKMDVEEKQQQKQHPQKSLILERIKFCLNKRDQLIEYLDELNITPNIVKDILDLDVTTIILEGETSLDSIRVLQRLKSVLLHKYFPDDKKIRKKYQKISKKTQSRMTTAEQEQSLQDLSLRRKTILKLQKILRSLDSMIDPKQKAIQIESHFRKQDEQIGNGYKTIAYKVLRCLKDKSQSVDDVMSKLYNGQFQYEEK